MSAMMIYGTMHKAQLPARIWFLICRGLTPMPAFPCHSKFVIDSFRYSLAKLTGQSPEPSVQALNYLIEVYRANIHLQPLPLLALDGLAEYLTRAPRFLRWSFLALTLSFSCPNFYLGKEAEAIEFYTRSAQEATNGLAAEGLSTVELTQSLCLLALGYIKGRPPCFYSCVKMSTGP